MSVSKVNLILYYEYGWGIVWTASLFYFLNLIWDPIERPFAYALYVENIVVLIETFEIYKNNVAIKLFNNV